MFSAAVRRFAAIFILSVSFCISQPCWADCAKGTLTAGAGEDLVINNSCLVDGTVPSGKYSYGNVNIVQGGTLKFVDATIDFWAKSILVENNGSLLAGTDAPIGTKGTLTIHLYGADGGTNGTGIACVSDAKNQCGIPDTIWGPNGSEKVCQNGIKPDCSDGVFDYFYQYMPLDYDRANPKAYFGYKVLAVSYGGTLKLFGSKGASAGNLQPFQSGTSWARLNGSVATGKNTLTLDRVVDWKTNDHIVLTTTDYLPGHSEELTVKSNVLGNNGSVSIITVNEQFQYPHYGQVFSLAGVPAGVGPDPDPNLGPQRYVETRAAVGLLTRSIRIVSGGDKLGDPFYAESTHQFFGGHTMFRQGFKQIQIQGVEFAQMGQGGRIMHYPVHFHMARLTPPETFIVDSSINESMTRWITVHATQGITIARNVGWKSIGHGFYLEDGTETDNKFYSNLGVFARGAVMAADPSKEKYNPRQVPGILAAAYPAWNDGTVPQEYVPYHTDIDHPTVFWIMNGWNDFQYNHAAGAGTCGVCYWLVPGANSTMSRAEKWEGYAAEQSTPDRAAMTPLRSFIGNTCSTAMTSFNTVGDTSICRGVINENPAAKIPVLIPVNNPLAPAPPPPPPPSDSLSGREPAASAGMGPMGGGDIQGDADSYYPVVSGGGGRFATLCPEGADCSTVPRCGNGNLDNCVPTIIDHFTSSFSWAETNFSSVWLRPFWYLYINSALTDVQNGGLTIVTGGGYTSSDVISGHWALAKKDVFIGNTQDNTSQYASNAGAVTPTSTLHCARRADGSPAGGPCLVRDAADNEETVSLQESNFSVNQRFFNIYDGPAYESSNAYLDITTTPLTDCTPGPSPCYASKFSQGWTVGVLKDKSNQCYLPNAAIGWKQPNGFYYPPAFHSDNLFFKKVDIRHFVIEPLFVGSSYKTSDSAVAKRYCTYNPSDPNGNGGLFTGFTDIDRQTELSDDDGTLTGLDSTNVALKTGTISVNEDAFFNAPLETTECASDSLNAPPPTATAKTSPYDYVTTAVFPYCGVTCDQKIWAKQCTNDTCFGVPLYREFVKQGELGTKPFIRMAGQSVGQRSTLTVNHGSFYMDTTTSPTDQQTYTWKNIFEAGKTYYTFLLFAKPSTTQKYSMYVGPGITADNVAAVRAHTEGQGKQPIYFTAADWPSTWDKKVMNGVLTVTIDMKFTDFENNYNTAKQNRCQPQSFCSSTNGVCGCKLGSNDPLYKDCKDICSSGADPDCPGGVCTGWASKDVDCPEGGCYGFSFTLSQNFSTGPKPGLPPATGCYDTGSSGPWNLSFTRHDQQGQQCYYSTLPVIEGCSSKK